MLIASLLSSLRVTGLAPVIVVLKSTAQAASTVDPDELKRHFIRNAATQDGGIMASLRMSSNRRAKRAVAAESQEPPPPSMRYYPNLGVVYGTIDASGLRALSRDDKRVKSILPASPVRIIRPVRVSAAKLEHELTWGIQSLNVQRLWDKGIRGKGILVGHLDTGVDGKHPALKGAIHAFAEFDSLGRRIDREPSQAVDSDQHGTHTAGTIAGREVGGHAIGVAPESQLASAMVIEGGNVIARILGGMDWSIEKQVRVLSMSLGFPGWVEDFLPLTQILRRRNILPVFAVGNEGPVTSRSPGNYPEALSVGAHDSNKLVADFSSSQRFNRKKDPIVPDLVAPGVGVVSCVPGKRYAEMDGTSMATPHIAGLAALLMQAAEGKSVNEIEQAIFKSCTLAKPMTKPRANRGMPDAVKALKLLKTS